MIQFDGAGYGQAIRSEEIAKSIFSATARNARRAARAGRRQARVQARGGSLIQRHVTAPIKADLNAAMTDANRQVDVTVRRINQAGDSASRTVTRSADDASKIIGRSGKKAGLWIAGGTAGGIGGGVTLAELGRRGVKRVDERYPSKRNQNQNQYALAKAESPDITDYPAGFYGYLLPTIREEIAAIPDTRRNPISPLQQVAGSRLMADGTRKIRSHNPFFRQRRTREGMYQIVMGQQMTNRGVGATL